jgi:hypothetical protein
MPPLSAAERICGVSKASPPDFERELDETTVN